jgi:hypothetical protein
MLYLCRSRINVPRDRRLGNLPTSMMQSVARGRGQLELRFRYFEPEEKYFELTHRW